MPDLEGGNFSISNPGPFGSMFGTPLINYPQSAVFNMNGIQERVMAINGQAEIRPVSVLPFFHSRFWFSMLISGVADDVCQPYLRPPTD